MTKSLTLIFLFFSMIAFAQSPKKFYKQAQKDIEAKNYKDAEFNLTEALRLKPNNFRYYLMRAQTREKMQKLQEALEDYMVCIAIKKHDKKLLMKAADLNIALQKYPDAIKVLSDLLSFDEKNNDAISKKVWCLIITKQFKEAVAVCDASFNKNYYNHLTHFYKAVALDSLKEYDGALKDYTTAITLMKNEGDNAKSPLPKYKPYFANIALVEHKLKKYDEALKNYTTAAGVDQADTVLPKNYLIYYNRSNSYLDKSDFVNALGDLTKSIVLNDKEKESFYRRGFVNQLTKQFQSAISDYTKTIGLDSKHFAAIKGRAQCYAELGMMQEAIADFTVAGGLRPDDKEVSEALAATKKKLFEANRENDDPEITISYPVTESTGFVNIFVSQADLIVEGSIRDKSLIEKITVNNTACTFKNEKNPSFFCRIPIENVNAVEIAATDVYGNTSTKKLKIGRLVDDSKVKVVFSGRLLSDDGTNRPFTNSNVYLTNEKGEVLYTTKTDEKGKFIFRNLGYENNYMLSMDAEDTPLKDSPGFRMVDENGKTIMTGVSDGKKKFKFSILPMDYNVMTMMSIDDAPLMLDIKGKLVANNDDKTPIGNIKFLLLNERKEAMTFTTTEGDGKFTFANVMPYDYEFSIDDLDSKKIPYEQILVTDEKGRILKQIKKDGEGKFRFRLLDQEKNFLSSIALAETDPWLSLDNLNKENKEKTIIENIYYESGSFKILPSAEDVLKKTIEAMKKNPKLTLEVQSHTDAVAGDEYNMELSIKRANAVVDYIITKGMIDKKRLSAKGFGETQLSNRCVNGVECSDAEHKQNRRTVFVLNFNEKLK
jgi:tetratricopeptide (TPR) repeat protein/outer membrane protein OmpA-like peptidoglycan-associated protein